jgi:hypothetical protein
MRRRGLGERGDLKEGSPSPPLVMSVLVCVCVLPKGRSLSSSLPISFPAPPSQLAIELLVPCYRPSLASEPMRAAVDSGLRWPHGGGRFAVDRCLASAVRSCRPAEQMIQ